MSSASVKADDTRLWFEGGLRGEPIDDLDLSLDQLLRLENDVSEIGMVGLEPKVELRITKWMELGGGYRLSYEPRGPKKSRVFHRFFGGPEFRLKLRPVTTRLRLRYQEDLRFAKKGTKAEHTARARLGFELDLDEEWAPYVDGEIWVALARGGVAAEEDRWRIKVGMQWELGQESWDVSYRVQGPFAGPGLDHILGLDYRLEL
ncbi:MAG: DUF2490 domain-containing protein [Myxococcales bacterium]|nr:DUF2490 domain-containing protein [Myxococcales bacterium]